MNFKYDFLDNNAYIAIDNIRKKYKQYYDLVFMVIELIVEIMNDSKCTKCKDNREKYIIGTLWDCYTTYSSEILLLERGLLTDYNVLLRTFYEKKFKLFAVINNKRNFKYVLDEAKYFTANLANDILKNKNNTFDDLQGKLKGKEFDFSILNKKQKSVEAWANNGGLISEYEKQYTLLSEKVHYGIGSLAEKFEVNDEGKMIYLSYSYKDFEENIIVASYEMFICILKFLEFIKNESYSKEIDSIWKKFEKINIKE